MRKISLEWPVKDLGLVRFSKSQIVIVLLALAKYLEEGSTLIAVTGDFDAFHLLFFKHKIIIIIKNFLLNEFSFSSFFTVLFWIR